MKPGCQQLGSMTQNLTTIIVGHLELLEELLSLSLESSRLRWWHFGHGPNFELLISCLYVTAWRLPANCQPQPVLHSEGEVDKLIVAWWATFEKSLTTIHISNAGLSSRYCDIPSISSLTFSSSLANLFISDLMRSLLASQSCERGIGAAATQSTKLAEEEVAPDEEEDVVSCRLSANPMRGDSAKYDKSAILPHLPKSWIVTGSRPHAERVRAPVMRNVCPETNQVPALSLATPPDRQTASQMVSTTPSLVQ